MDVKPSIFRRFSAWILDSIMALAVLAATVVFFYTPEYLSTQPALDQIVSSSRILQDKGQEIQKEIEALKTRLQPGEWEKLGLAVQKSIRVSGQDIWTKLMAGEPEWVQGFEAIPNRIISSLSPTELGIKDPKSLALLGSVSRRTQELLKELTLWDLIFDIGPKVLPLALIPLGAYLLWFLPEFLFGATVFQILFGLKTATKDGYKTNLVVYFFRFVLKHGGLVMILAGIYWNQNVLWASGLGVQLLMYLSVVNLLGPRRQMLYEVLSGTILLPKKSMAENQGQ